MIRKLTVALGIALSISACASAAKRTEQGQQLQQQGRPADAAGRYYQALKKDRTIQAARDGLRSAGAEAIDGWLRAAASPTTGADAAAQDFLAIDDLTNKAIEVGIYLVTPADYAARKRAAFDRGIQSALINAQQSAGGGNYADAVSGIQNAVNSYQPNATQSAQLGNAAADVALSWARSDTAQGRFRSGYSRVEQIGSLPGVTSAQTSAASALRSNALARGTKKVAIVPTWGTVNARRDLPEDVLPALGDALLGDPWQSPPAFVSLVPAAQVLLELRGLGFNRRTLSTVDAARFALLTGADYAVVTEIDTVRRSDFGVRVTRHPVKTRNGIDTAYFTEEGQTQLYAGATISIIDRTGQRLGNYQPMSASVNGSFTRVRYNGDIRQLDLRQAERDLFNGQSSNDRELVSSFVAAMSPRLAQAVFAQVLQTIP